MKKKSPMLTIAIGATFVVAVVVLRGLLPELYRYYKIRRM
jgi:membrane protein YdbS with pleckstrin-like domain